MNPLKRGLNSGVEADEAPRLLLAEGREEAGACLWEEPFAEHPPSYIVLFPFSFLSPSLRLPFPAHGRRGRSVPGQGTREAEGSCSSSSALRSPEPPPPPLL